MNEEKIEVSEIRAASLAVGWPYDEVEKVWQTAIAQERIESQKREAELRERVNELEEQIKRYGWA